ncbi:MAG: hypothetical protein ACRDZO_05040 [Egibacteraceae bacterium]
MVRVFNDLGECRAVAKVSDKVIGGALHTEYGYWRQLAPGSSTAATTLTADFTDIGYGAQVSHAYVDVEPL